MVSIFHVSALLLFISKLMNSIVISPVHCQISHHQGQVTELRITSSATNPHQYILHRAPIRVGQAVRWIWTSFVYIITPSWTNPAPASSLLFVVISPECELSTCKNPASRPTMPQPPPLCSTRT